MMNLLVPIMADHVPALIVAGGEKTAYRFLEFFTQIRNPHTRRAYARAALEFFDWLEAEGVTQLATIESVARRETYIEQLSRARSAPTAKLRLAALRHLFDWMVIGQIMPTKSDRRRARAAPHRATRQDAGARPRRGAPASRRDRHNDRHWPPRPGSIPSRESARRS